MKILILLNFMLIVSVFADTLSFGAISTVDSTIMQKKLNPLIQYISKTISKEMKFETGFDYADTIEQFKNGHYDFGFIGPSPFVITSKNTKNKLKIIVGLNNKCHGKFHSVIVVRKDSSIAKLEDLKGKTFAFGSPQSTLSYFMPMNLLQKNSIVKYLARYDFLGKHDKVAKYIIMGKYDAGAIKSSIAKKYSKYIRVIAKTKDVPDFVVVASAKTPDMVVQKIRKALLKPEAQKLAKYIKPSATGFRLRKYSDYHELEQIMQEVNAAF
jgi:phosphonate transport system substrate-binding protein